jgi:8-oxo-dGTP diphosphatase
MRGDGDGWVVCDARHRHWGRYGAAGLLLSRAAPTGLEVLLQFRVGWSHHGDTWGLPGGARDSDETPVQAALREAAEEVGFDSRSGRVLGLYRDDHGGWVYDTVLAAADGEVRVRATAVETAAIRWVPVAAVGGLVLHPGFAVSWPRLRNLLRGRPGAPPSGPVGATPGRRGPC